jgi:hypothetical protein
MPTSPAAETWPIRSTAFRHWITQLLFEANGAIRAPSGQAVLDVVRTCEAGLVTDCRQDMNLDRDRFRPHWIHRRGAAFEPGTRQTAGPSVFGLRVPLPRPHPRPVAATE